MVLSLAWSRNIWAGEASPVTVRPARGLPEAGALHALRAMEERFLHVHRDRELRGLALGGQARQPLGIAHDPGAAVDPQRLLAARHQEEEPDAGVLEQVPHPVEALVARTVRDQQGPLVHHQDEAGRVALGAHVAAARAVRGRHEHEGRPRDEGAAMLVDPADVLAQGDLGGLAHQRAQLVEGPHHVLELRRPIRSAHALASREDLSCPRTYHHRSAQVSIRSV